MIGPGIAATFARSRPLTSALPPAFTALPQASLAGRVVTVTTGTAAGSPPPGFALTMTEDGQPVSPSGSGPWSYSVASAAQARQIGWQVTAQNAGGAVQAAGTLTVAADLAANAPLTAIAANGWQASYPDPPDFDPVAAPEVVNVTRAGFDATGTPVSVTEALTVMTRLRQPYPNQATLSADQVALSEFVHAGDSLAGIANNSTRPYPKPICCWLTPDLERAESATFTVRLAVAHGYARQGRPVAAVRFIASDGTHTVSQLASVMSARQWASGLHAPYFEAALDVSGLAAGAICTVDAVVYPWVGAAFQASVDGAAYPSINFTVLKFLNDRSGSYGTAYAYVDATAGSNGSGSVSASATAAQAAAFQTVAAAAAAIKSFNAAQFGRNEAAGGVIRLVAGSHAHSSFQAATCNAFPLLIEAADPAARASTIYTDNGTSVSGGLPGKVKFRNLTLRKAGGSVILLDNSASLAALDRMITLDGVVFDRNGSTSYAGWIYRTGRLYMVECSGDPAGGIASFGTATKEITLIGCALPLQSGTAVYNACASRFGWGSDAVATSGVEAAAGQLFQHCFLTQSAASGKAMLVAGAVGAGGLAVIGSVLEATGGNTAPAASISADNATQPVQNLLFVGNTVVGARTNWLYQDSGTATVAKSGRMRFTVNTDFNVKSDVFGQNAALIGNWPAIYQVGCCGNAALLGATDGFGYGPGHWLGELAGLGDTAGSAAAPLAADWADDQSFGAGGAGGGDYTPGPGHALPRIPAGLAPFPLDQAGRAVDDAGAGVSGALQPAG